MNFKDLRKRKFEYAKDFAAAIGVERSRVSKWETGYSAPSRKLWSLIANTLDCSVDDILNCFREK